MEARYENLKEARALLTRIELRLNPDEHTELLAAIKEVQGNPNGPNEAIDVRVRKLIAATQPVLKSEWERVKRGEKAFVWSKRAAIGIVAIALLAISALAVRAYLNYEPGKLLPTRSVSIPCPYPSTGDAGWLATL